MPIGTTIDFDMFSRSGSKISVVAIVLDYWVFGISAPFAPDSQKHFLTCYDSTGLRCVFYEYLLSVQYIFELPLVSHAPIYELLVGNKKIYLSQKYIDIYNEHVVEAMKCQQ